MSMQSQLWSVNALSNELNMDRRTLAKKLSGLPPAETKKVGGRTERRWKMVDVVEHLSRLKAPRKDGDKAPPINGYRILHIDAITHFIDWAAPKMWEEWQLDMSEAGMQEELIAGTYKNFYFLLVTVMSQYLTQDMYNKRLKDSDGMGFDDLHALAHGEPITSHPPTGSELGISIPDFIKDMLSSNDRQMLTEAGAEI